MKKLILISSLLAAGTLGAWADATAVSADSSDPTLLNVTAGSVTSVGGDYSVTDNTTAAVDGYLRFYNSANQYGNTAGMSSLGFTGTVTGSGTLEIFFQTGGANSTLDLTSANFSGFTGQLAVVNAFNKAVTVNLSGTNWSGVEYLMGTVSSTADGWTITRGYESGTKDTLHLTENTTLAGITGTAKGATTTFNNVEYNLNELEAITAATGKTLTLGGAGTYSYYGAFGTSTAAISLTHSGNGTQTLGGTNYLNAITVSAGKLALEGTTTIAGTVNVTGGELSLAGTLSLASSITNSGTVTIDENAKINVASAMLVDGAITLVSNTGTLDWDSWLSNVQTNLTIGGAALTDRQSVSGDNGVLTVTSTNYSLTWIDGTGTWDATKTWNYASGTTTFIDGDTVSFNGSTDSGTVTLSGSHTAAAMNVSSGTWTFAASTNNTLSVTGAITLTNNADVTLSGGIANFSWGSVSIAEGSTLDVGAATGNPTTLKDITGAGTLKISSTGHYGLKLVTSTDATAASDFTGTIVWTGKYNPVQSVINSNATLELHATSSSASMWAGNVATVDYNVLFATNYQIGDNTRDNSATITFNSAVSGASGTTLLIGGNYSAAIPVTFAGTMNFSNATISTVAKASAGDVSINCAATLNIDATASGTIKNLNSGGTTGISRTSSTTGTLSIENLNVSAGKTTVYINDVTKATNLTGVPISISNLSVASGATFVLAATYASDVLYLSNNFKFDTMTLAGGSTVKFLTVNTAQPTGNLKTLQIDTLTVANADSSTAVLSVQGDSSANKASAGWTVDKLTGSGTLQFLAAAASGATATCGVLNIGGTVATDSTTSAAQSITTSTNTSNFTGTLEITCDSSTAAAGAVAVLYTSLANAEVSLLTSKSHLAIKNNATIAGLSSASDATGASVYSGTARSDDTTNYLVHDTSAKTLTIDVSTTTDGEGKTVDPDYSYSGTIAGVALVKTGTGTQTLAGTISDYTSGTNTAQSSVSVSAGTLVLSAANSYTGATTITGGKVIAENSSALGASGNVTVSGGTLVVAASDGVTVNGAVSFLSGGQFAIDLSKMTATTSSADELVLTIITATTLAYVDSSGNFSSVSSETVDDHFDSLSSTLGDYETWQRTWEILGTAGSGQTLQLTLSIPEPSMFGLLAGTLALALAGTRRRRRGNAK